MKFTNFIQSAKEYLRLHDFEKSSKKKSIKSLLKKLRTKRKEIKKSIKEIEKQEHLKEFEEELDIVCLQIKKGKELLKELQDA